MDEVFVQVDGYPNYVISNYGTILNEKFDRELTATTDRRDGLRKVTLYKNGIGKEYYIHRLVAKAFFVNYEDHRPVLFINDDPMDCSVLNLTIGIHVRSGVQNDAQTQIQAE